MSSFNKVFLMGNLTRDPQVRHLSSNSLVTEFGLACSRRFRTATGEDREDTAFVDCTAFGRQAEVLGQFCKKGKPLFVEGRLKYDAWEDKQTGGKRNKLSVVVENFQFVGPRESSERAGNPANPPPAPASKRSPRLPFTEERQFEEADIPF